MEKNNRSFPIITIRLFIEYQSNMNDEARYSKVLQVS